MRQYEIVDGSARTSEKPLKVLNMDPEK